MSRRILVLVAVLIVALAILTGLAVRRGVLGAQEQTAAVGGPFQLTDQTGRTVGEDVLKGKWSAVFFGFIHCPDICPTTMFKLGQVETALGGAANGFQTVFISVDPVRDTPAEMARYLANDAFPRRTIGLTGTGAQVDAAARAYRAPVMRQGEGADYTVNHVSYAYLMGPRGQFVCVLPYGATPQAVAAKVKAAMAAGPRADNC